MKMRFLVAVAAMLAAAPLAAAGTVEGRWITADKDAVIRMAPCGSKLCGTVERFLVPPPQGLDQRDVNNKDAKLRSRKLLGMPVLTGFALEDGVWRGQIYDPKSGKTYRSVLESAGNVLKVKGCISIFCQTQTWTRAK